MHSLSGTTGHEHRGNESGKVIEILANKTKVVRRNKFGDKVIKTMSKKEVSVKSLSNKYETGHTDKISIDAIKRSGPGSKGRLTLQ